MGSWGVWGDGGRTSRPRLPVTTEPGLKPEQGLLTHPEDAVVA